MTLRVRFASTFALAGAFCMLLSSAGPADAKETDPRARQLVETCLGCHGSDTYFNAYPNYKVPKLGGQNVDYIVIALQAYRDGQRAHETMHSQAATMSDAEMRQIGEWFAARGGNPSEPADVPAQAEACAACHGRNGASTVPAYPNLGGQHADYLLYSLRGYQDGTRQNAIMAGLAGPLTEQDLETLARYFASLDGLATPTRD